MLPGSHSIGGIFGVLPHRDAEGPGCVPRGGLLRRGHAGDVVRRAGAGGRGPQPPRRGRRRSSTRTRSSTPSPPSCESCCRAAASSPAVPRVVVQEVIEVTMQLYAVQGDRLERWTAWTLLSLIGLNLVLTPLAIWSGRRTYVLAVDIVTDAAYAIWNAAVTSPIGCAKNASFRFGVSLRIAAKTSSCAGMILNSDCAHR